MNKQNKEQLSRLISGRESHLPFSKAVEGLSFENTGVVPDKLPYSIWQLVEHIRIAQEDILQFAIDENHQSPEWPDEYWPKETAPADEEQWKNAVKKINADLEKMQALIQDENLDISARIPHGDDQTYLRQAVLTGLHNAYHTGQIIVIRRLLGDW